MLRVFLAPTLLLFAFAGCKKEAPPAPAPAAPTAEPSRLADPACVGRWDDSGATRTVESGGKTFTVKGSRVEETTKDDDDQLVLGVVADVKEDTPENIANLDAIIKFFKESKVEAIVVDGDLGEDQKQIENVLAKLAESGLPLFSIIGNRDSRAAYDNAMAAVSARYPGLFNLDQIRAVSFDDGALVSMPGYHNKVYIHAEDGCLYGPADLEATKPAVAALKGKTIVMVSHGPPKQDGADALDRTLEQVNVGDPAMSEFLREQGIKLGIFANVREAGGRATNLPGMALVKEGVFSEELYLSNGPADSVRWTMNDGTESVGMASLFTIKGNKASFKTFRVHPKATKK